MRIITLHSNQGRSIDFIVDNIVSWTTMETAYPSYTLITTIDGRYEVRETREEISDMIRCAE